MSAPVTVAIVSWNTRDLLGSCLESLEGDVEAGRVEAWVADNASTDGSPELVRGEFGWAHLLAGEENLGFGTAVNEVAARTRSPWLAAANADIVFGAESIRHLLASGEANPGTGVIAPRLVSADGSTQPSVHPFPTPVNAALIALGAPRWSRAAARRLGSDSDAPGKARQIDWAHGALLLIRRIAFDAVGGFERAQWMYAEDLDLCWRMKRAGWRVRYEPGVEVAHLGAASTRQAFGDDPGARWMGATFAWMAARRGLVVTRAYAAISLAGAGLRWLALAILAVPAPGRFSSRRDQARRWFALHRIGFARRSRLAKLR